MKKIIAALLAALAVQAQATTTWTSSSEDTRATAVCTTGTESAPSGATSGLPLGYISGFTVFVETAGTMTAGGKLDAYLYNPETASWVRAPDMDLVVQALAKQSFAGFQVTARVGRVAFVPNGVGLASTIYIIGQRT